MNPFEIGLEAEDLAQYCPNCRHPMIHHIDEAAEWAICEALTGPYGGTQCKCNYATEAVKHEGRHACESWPNQLPDCCEPSHVVNSSEWWSAVLWSRRGGLPDEKPCVSKQDAEDTALLEFFAPTEKPPPDDMRKVYGVLDNLSHTVMYSHAVQSSVHSLGYGYDGYEEVTHSG